MPRKNNFETFVTFRCWCFFSSSSRFPIKWRLLFYSTDIVSIRSLSDGDVNDFDDNNVGKEESNDININISNNKSNNNNNNSGSGRSRNLGFDDELRHRTNWFDPRDWKKFWRHRMAFSKHRRLAHCWTPLSSAKATDFSCNKRLAPIWKRAVISTSASD